MVLSHTNVARREIESRLGQSKPLAQLLGYPHFIGTFQTFADQFLALPFLRVEGIEVTAIDDEKFSARALSSFAKGPYWNAKAALAKHLVVLLKAIMPEPNNPGLQEFLKWGGRQEPEPQAGGENKLESENILIHKSENGEVTLRFDSIHGVKGETHAATLVVETFSRTHDIAALLPVLTGNQKATSLAKTAIDHCKRVFVGMTRPSELVCIAISAGHINANDIELLKKAGWHVEEVI